MVTLGTSKSKARLTERVRAMASGAARYWRWVAVGLITVIVAVIGIIGAQRDPHTRPAPMHFWLWHDRVVDAAFDQPHFSEPQARLEAPATLNGRVIFRDGKGASAITVLWCAEPKSNVIYTVSNRYPHLPRTAKTDSRGDFQFDALDPRWAYDVAVVAPGCPMQRYLNVDPGSGRITVTAELLVTSNRPPDTFLRGRVVDVGGHPIPGALLKEHGTTRGDSTTWPAQDIDWFAMSDQDGNFLVQAKTPFVEADGSVSADGFGTSLFEHWKSGDEANEVVLSPGVSLRGTVLQDGKPVSNVEIRVDSFGRDTDADAWNYSAVTDDGGRFQFSHLPPNRTCNLYATMQSLAGRGTVPTRSASTYGDGTTNDIGDIPVQPAFKIQGRIRLRGGRPIPPNSEIVVGRSADWYEDSMPVLVNRDGSFQCAGVPAGKVTLYLKVPGYIVSGEDLRLMGGPAVHINISRDVTNLVVNMRPPTKTDVLGNRLWYFLRLHHL